MTVEHVGLCLEIDSGSLAVEVVHVVVEARSATSTGDDDVLKLGDLMEHVVLHLSESFLAPLVKELLGRPSHPRLYVPVEVIERLAQTEGQLASDGSLACPHVADEDDAASSPRRYQRVAGYEGRVGCLDLGSHDRFFRTLALGSGALLTISIHCSSVRSVAVSRWFLGMR